MEFWGVEVKPGVPLKVEPENDCCIHLSQAALGESKKGNESVCLLVNINKQKLVLGHLSTEKHPQLAFDLIFDQEFELSHNSKNSVFFIGYQSESQFETDSEEDSDADEPVHLENVDNGIQHVEDKKGEAALAPKSVKDKPETSSKQKSKPVSVKDIKASADSDEDDSDEDDSDEDDSDDESGSDEGMSIDGDDDSAEDEDDSESEDEETPKKAGKAGNKRANDSAVKTPVPSKKQKGTATPQKTDAKKGVHTATPHPAKAAAKTSANGPNAKTQTPKSGGKFTCGSCDRGFGSDAALQSHSKAKHSAK